MNEACPECGRTCIPAEELRQTSNACTGCETMIRSIYLNGQILEQKILAEESFRRGFWVSSLEQSQQLWREDMKIARDRRKNAASQP